MITEAEVRDLINTNIPNNNQGLIKEPMVREVFNTVLDYFIERLARTSGLQGVTEVGNETDQPITVFKLFLYSLIDTQKKSELRFNGADNRTIVMPDENGTLATREWVNENAGGDVAWDDVTGKPSTFSPSAHTHPWSEVTGKPTTFTPSAHGHPWGDITDKPTTFTPSAHSHVASDVTDLAAAILAQVLTGYAAGSSSPIAATDTILQAFGKVQQQLNSKGADLAASWQAGPVMDGVAYTGVAYGNGKFVAVSSTGLLRAFYSDDGKTWYGGGDELNSWKAVTFGNGLFVAVASDGTSRVMTSPDGVTWTGRTAAQANPWSGVAYGNGLFVAVATSGTNRVMTSPDGITWTVRTHAQANSWNAVTFGNGLFVAVASTGTNRVMTSPDGITWTVRTASSAQTWSTVTYGNGLFVAGSSGGLYHSIMTSPDGITWTSRTLPYLDGVPSVAVLTFGGGTFVAVGNNSILSSRDGITWTIRTAPSGADVMNSYTAVGYGNGLFIAIASVSDGILTNVALSGTLGMVPQVISDWIDFSSASTIVGWSSFTTKIIRYQLSHKRLTVMFHISGTSNSGTASFTLPFSAAATIGLDAVFQGANSGSHSLLWGAVPASGSTMTFAVYNALNDVTTFVSSGTKTVRGQFILEIS